MDLIVFYRVYLDPQLLDKSRFYFISQSPLSSSESFIKIDLWKDREIFVIYLFNVQ